MIYFVPFFVCFVLIFRVKHYRFPQKVFFVPFFVWFVLNF